MRKFTSSGVKCLCYLSVNGFGRTSSNKLAIINNSTPFFMKNKVHIGDEIKKELHKQERSIAWLARKIQIDPDNFRKQLNSGKIAPDKLSRISEILGKDYLSLYFKQLANEE